MFPTVLFLRIGTRDLSNVTAVMGARGIAFTSGNGITVARLGFGAFPLACGLFLFGGICLQRLRSGDAGRGGADRASRRDVCRLFRSRKHAPGAELLLLFLTTIGILIEIFRKRHVVAAELPSAMVSR